jgi:hypothetical protein
MEVMGREGGINPGYTMVGGHGAWKGPDHSDQNMYLDDVNRL